MYKARRYLRSKSLVNLCHSYRYIVILFIVSNHGVRLHIVILSPYLNYKKISYNYYFFYYNAHTEPIFNNLNILPLYKLIHNRIGILVYKYANDMLLLVMNELFIVNSTIHDHNTGQKNLIHTNRGHTYISTFNNVGPRVWNALLNKINVNVSISQFKQKT